jgi:hypothetical protein
MLDCKGQSKLYNSLIKYGLESHKFEVLELCTFDDLNIKERYWQDFYNAIDSKVGLNCLLTETSTKPQRLSQETKDKIGKANSGDNHWTRHKPYTEEHRKNQSIAGKGKKMGKDNPMFGKVGKLCPNFGRKYSEERKEQMRQQRLGFKHSESTKSKLREMHKNQKWSKDAIEKRRQTKKEQTLILNLETGIYYLGYEEAGDTIDMQAKYLAQRLRGHTKNKTSFVLCYTKNKVYL